jgi:hypothetical protein
LKSSSFAPIRIEATGFDRDVRPRWREGEQAPPLQPVPRKDITVIEIFERKVGHLNIARATQYQNPQMVGETLSVSEPVDARGRRLDDTPGGAYALAPWPGRRS